MRNVKAWTVTEKDISPTTIWVEERDFNKVKSHVTSGLKLSRTKSSNTLFIKIYSLILTNLRKF